MTVAARLRMAARLASLAMTLAGALVLHGAWRIVGRPSPWPRWFLGRVAQIVGARPRIVGTAPTGDPTRNIVIVANHLSWIDILLLAGATGCTFVAKAELQAAPLVGWLCTLNGTLFVARENRMGVAAQIDRLRTAIAGDRPVALFPEGTTGDGVTLLPFKAALLAVLDPPPPGVRVQPVRIDYGDATGDIAWIGDEPGASHALRVLARRGTFVATLAFAMPFVPEGGRKDVAARARAAIEAMASGNT